MKSLRFAKVGKVVFYFVKAHIAKDFPRHHAAGNQMTFIVAKIRAAILAGDLPKYDDPDHPPYILVRQDELEAWAQKQAAKPQGNPQFGKDFWSKRKAQE